MLRSRNSEKAHIGQATVILSRGLKRLDCLKRVNPMILLQRGPSRQVHHIFPTDIPYVRSYSAARPRSPDK
jgi:hypothetical protein